MQDNTQMAQPEQKPNDKELNFRRLEERYQRQLEQERAARLEAERKAQELAQRKMSSNDDDQDDDEPYVNRNKLRKELTSFKQQLESQFDQRAEEKARSLLQAEKKEGWLRQNSDFYDVMQHAEKLAQRDPELAETILAMPDGFERQKLVYKNIKALGLHQPERKEPSIQEKIDANRRSPYYQPSGVGSAPYASMGDFSAQGQKQAYEKMKELKSKLRI